MCSREREEALLEKVRKVFGLKCIIKICMNDKVLEGAQKLLENAEVIKGTVDLRGASIALDDCYEVRRRRIQAQAGRLPCAHTRARTCGSGAAESRAEPPR